MVSVKYSHRILIDSDFILWLLKQPDKNRLYSNLMHIKSSSEQWKKCHNIILKSEIAEARKSKGLVLPEESIGAIARITEGEGYLLNYEQQISRNIIQSIEFTDEQPYKCYLFTSPEKEEDYLKNKHYLGITTVKIISGESARKTISEMFLAFTVERDIQRL